VGNRGSEARDLLLDARLSRSCFPENEAKPARTASIQYRVMSSGVVTVTARYSPVVL
jgi:hypothetical protein